jgi:hypothetical protein
MTNTDIALSPVADEAKHIKATGIEQYKEAMLKSHRSILAQVKERLVQRTAERNIALQNNATTMSDRINVNAARIAELSDAIKALTVENKELQAERRETEQRLKDEFAKDEADYRQMIAAEELAIKTLDGQG